MELETVRRLINCEKLSLILDLDQTVIHASVDRSLQSHLQQFEVVGCGRQ